MEIVCQIWASHTISVRIITDLYRNTVSSVKTKIFLKFCHYQRFVVEMYSTTNVTHMLKHWTRKCSAMGTDINNSYLQMIFTMTKLLCQEIWECYHVEEYQKEVLYRTLSNISDLSLTKLLAVTEIFNIRLIERKWID